MREYWRDDKMVLHSTDIWNYEICPQLFKQSREQEFAPTEAMRDGLIFEALVFGEKEKGDLAKYKGRKKIEWLEELAEKAKPYFRNGQPFARTEAEYNGVILTGEIDYRNEFKYDLKLTSDITNWTKKTNRMAFLQAVYYNFLDHLNGLPVTPFHYVICTETLIKVIVVNVSEMDFAWLQDKINRILSDPFLDPNLDGCHSQPYGKCRLLGSCPFYLKKASEETVINFGDLE